LVLVTCQLALRYAASAKAAEAAPAVGSSDLSVPTLVQRCAPSVVLVRVLDSREQLVSTGSGFVVAPGLVATCYHVVAGGAIARVKTADRIEYPVAEVAASSRALDLALLRVFKLYDAPALELRDLAGIQVGEAAIAMGSPLGLEGSVTTGVVSGIREMGDWGTVIQTSAPASSGNSGGPLLDSRGRVLGLVQFTIVAGQNVNFAIPAAKLSDLMRLASTPAQPAETATPGLASGASGELLKPVGVLDPRTRSIKIRIPAKEPYSVALLPYHQYDDSSLAATIDGKRLSRVQHQQGITPASFWVSDLGTIWFDRSYAKKEAAISFEYRPFRIAVSALADDSGGDLAEILLERVRALGDEPLVGADVTAALARASSAGGENALRDVGRKLSCAYLAAATLKSSRITWGQYTDMVSVQVGLTVADLNTGKLLINDSRQASYALGRLRKGNSDRRNCAGRLLDEMLSRLVTH
jgi:hypothetical protein